jgi:cbb3-type cytochrome oxidase subunit 3
MKPQDYKTHKRLIPTFHFLLFGLILIAFFASIYNLFTSDADEKLMAGLLLLFSIILIFLFFFTRIFALKAQDRAIRAEENIRHMMLTGKGLDKRLTIGQTIALRFAPDEEVLELAQTAAEKNMTPDEIKRAIRNWKADHYRA